MIGRLRAIAPELRWLNFRASDYPGGRGDTHIAGPYPQSSDWDLELA